MDKTFNLEITRYQAILLYEGLKLNKIVYQEHIEKMDKILKLALAPEIAEALQTYDKTINDLHNIIENGKASK